MEHISQAMGKLNMELKAAENKEQVPLVQELSSNGVLCHEKKVLEEIASGVRISIAPVSDMEAALRWCMLKVGIRANNLPGQEESLILFHHIVSYYGGHTIGEMKLAFDMAIAGQLELEDKEVNPYESFDCRYVSRIMNAYRIWSKQVYQQHIQETEKFLELPSPGNTDWREQVQKALEDFLLDKYNPRLWPAEMYDQVATDCFINGLAYHSFMSAARTKICSELQKELTGMKSQTEEDINNLPTGKYRDYQQAERKLIEYRSGDRDIEVILLAKQMALRHYFKYLKSVEVSKIYEPVKALP